PKDKIANLTNKIIALELQQVAQTQGASGTDSTLIANMAQALVKTIADSVGDINLEMWVGKKDYLLYQIKMDKVIDLSKVASSIASGMGLPASETNPNGQVELKFTMTNANFNKPVSVQVPENPQRIETVLLPSANQPPPVTNNLLEDDMRQLMTTANIIYTKNNNSFALICKNNALNGSMPTYGSQLVTIIRDVIKKGGKNIVCSSSIN
ncbi:MAG: hypothetical protein NT094_00670, partial [Candidatus Staskawiczbacteria bacterium]|nr:hypothetical protein [Candidatus Staskawiczbacteria bacterium]